MKVDIYNCLSHKEIYDLCRQINIPDEVTENVLNHVDNDDFTAINSYFGNLFSSKTAGWSVEKIEALCSERGELINHGYKIMTVFLAAAIHTRKLYSKLGIDDSIYIDTMGFFNRTVREYKELNSVYGFDRAFWWWRHLSLNVFRLGTLEFEMLIVDNAAQFGFFLEKNLPVIWVHIPSDAVMTRRKLNNSYKTARSFFKKHYPDFKYRCFCSGAWLLSPILKEILPPNSKIIEFQSDFAITKLYLDDQSYFTWVFKQKEKPANLSELPENITNSLHFVM